jgi:hypothetical protein
VTGDFYDFKVTAVNRVGESASSDSISLIASDLPGKPAKPVYAHADLE